MTFVTHEEVPVTEPRADRPNMPGYGVAGPDEGDGLLSWSWARDRLAAAHDYWVTTVSRDGAPHAVPVWGMWRDDCFYLSTGAKSRKARNLSTNARCVVHIENGPDPVVVEGSAARVTDQTELRPLLDAFEAKYSEPVPDPDNNPVFRVRPRRAFGWTKEFPDSATRWSFDA